MRLGGRFDGRLTGRQHGKPAGGGGGSPPPSSGAADFSNATNSGLVAATSL